MNIRSLTAHPKRSIPASAIACLGALAGLKPEDFGPPTGFELRRGRVTTIWLRYAAMRLTVNLSIQTSHWPKNFSEARDWMTMHYPGVTEMKRIAYSKAR